MRSSAGAGTGRRSSTPAPWPSVELGATTLGLNVFGPNDGARALYERAGYVTTERSYRIEL